MASVQLDPASKLYRIHFGGKVYFRSLGKTISMSSTSPSATCPTRSNATSGESKG
ncbi:hypothetical protein Sinac_2908 [Singulisphaera acidiphila DSM 18658]|uniref:Uncharacterized protein n=1 Tax=Singulisphaera acidiphila (strain ATCC BAA-1392 / DSM 18658 / VKM B-2454 / MOB10) TaxID=886293 RepID=L0DEA9_SINAD|nr:hypothetical protein Sinac_2908 [Singulisphaera acidiphila DSM 18658]